VKKKLNNIDHTWTLFLDRDGVINHQNMDGYILTWDEFIFYEGVLEAMSIFKKQFQHTFIVTNQRGVGRGHMSEDDLKSIHDQMQSSVEIAGGSINQVYFCPDIDNSSPGRKPNTGMALQAQQEFPAIDLTKSVMVGNSMSDMEFGRNVGAITVFLTTTNQTINDADERIDFVFKTLIDFAKVIKA
jgi:histidinol-phosphate phosphatase family protein